MLYARRNTSGDIVAVYSDAHGEATEVVSLDHPDFLAFITHGDPSEAFRTHLATSDAAMLRILEDLIAILIDKDVIEPADFPEAARTKLARRKMMRDRIRSR